MIKKIKIADSVKITNINKKKTKVVDSLNNRTLIIGFSNCGKTVAKILFYFENENQFL